MLTPEEQLAFRESIDRVRQLAVRGLAQTADAGRAVAFVANLHRGLDKMAVLAAASGPVPECRAGCAYCCHVRVEATEPEVLLIARGLRQRPPSELAEIIEKLERRVAASAVGEEATQKAASGDAGNARHNTARLACGFLREGYCSIYELRPAVCRKAHSLSVKQCAELAPEIPQNLKLVVEAEALMAGTAEAYQELRLAASAQELNAAVLAALAHPAAEARWFDAAGR